MQKFLELHVNESQLVFRLHQGGIGPLSCVWYELYVDKTLIPEAMQVPQEKKHFHVMYSK